MPSLRPNTSSAAQTNQSHHQERSIRSKSEESKYRICSSISQHNYSANYLRMNNHRQPLCTTIVGGTADSCSSSQCTSSTSNFQRTASFISLLSRTCCYLRSIYNNNLTTTITSTLSSSGNLPLRGTSACHANSKNCFDPGERNSTTTGSPRSQVMAVCSGGHSGGFEARASSVALLLAVLLAGQYINVKEI